MNFLKERLVEIGKTPAAFARALGLPKARAYEMQKGDRRLQPGEIGPAARFLEWSEAELVARLEGRSPAASGSHSSIRSADHNTVSEVRVPLRQADAAIPPLILWKSLPGGRAEIGGWMLIAEKTGEVPRPDFLFFSTRAFAVTILDDKMAPAYRTRDRALVDPDSPVTAGDDCLFTDTPDPPNGSEMIIGCLISSTAGLWKIRQHASKRERELQKSEFPNAWLIVGRYNRR